MQTKRLRHMFVLSLCVLAILAGCSSSKQADSASADNSSVSMASSAKEAEKASGDAKFDIAAVQDQYGETGSADTSGESTAASGNSAGIAADETMGQDAFNRKLIYHANLTMEVKDYPDMQSQIRDMTALAGGYVLQFSDQKSLHEQGGTFVLKVPSDSFFSFIEQLEKLKPISFQRSLRGQDVTEEYVDLSSRLKAKQVVEQRLLSFMDKAQKSDDLLKFSSELADVQEQIEQIKGRMRYIDQNVAYSTIELRVYERTDGLTTISDQGAGKNVGDRAWEAMKASGGWLSRFAAGLLVVLAGAIPILIPLGVIAAVIVVIYRKRAVKNQASTPSKPAENRDLPHIDEP